MSHGNVATGTGTCVVCRRSGVDVHLAPAIDAELGPVLVCVDEFGCFYAWCYAGAPGPARPGGAP